MTEADDTEANEDRGCVFWLVRMAGLSSTTLERLAPDVRCRVHANLERARRVFRSRTLPCPGSDSRLIASPFEVWSLTSELNAVIRECVGDRAALDALVSSESDVDDKGSLRIEIVKTGRDGGLEIRRASGLLEKYWYRYREMDVFDAIELGRDLQAARERGESGADIVNRVKPPAPPRRRQ